MRLCWVAGDTSESEARLMDATAGATTGGAAGAFATALAALAFFKFKGMLDKCKQSWSVLGTATQNACPTTFLLSLGRRHNNVYSLNNSWEASGRSV